MIKQEKKKGKEPLTWEYFWSQMCMFCKNGIGGLLN